VGDGRGKHPQQPRPQYHRAQGALLQQIRLPFFVEPTPWAMGVAHALNFAPQTIAHGAGSCTKPRLGPSPKAQGFGRALIH